MLQLELFPSLEFRSLLDFQRLQSTSLEAADRERVAHHSGFYTAPKANAIIRIQHAAMIDKILGYRTKYIEEMLIAEAQNFDPDGTHESWGPAIHNGVQTWIGLGVDTLQTPYSECLRILQLLKLKPYQHVVDLGAAYGRMGIIIGGLFLKNIFTGYEFVKGRVDEGNRIFRELDFSRCVLKQQDLADPEFSLPEADVYFIYDYGQVEHIDHTLKQIREVAKKRPVKVIQRGKYSRKIVTEGHPWLELKYESKLTDQFSIYSAFMP